MKYLLLTVSLFVSFSAVAQTTSEKLLFCTTAGEVALAATAARDVGVPLSQAEKMVTDTMKTPDQLELFSALVTLIYTMKGVEGPLMQQVAIQMCQHKLGLK